MSPSYSGNDIKEVFLNKKKIKPVIDQITKSTEIGFKVYYENKIQNIIKAKSLQIRVEENAINTTCFDHILTF